MMDDERGGELLLQHYALKRFLAAEQYPLTGTDCFTLRCFSLSLSLSNRHKTLNHQPNHTFCVLSTVTDITGLQVVCFAHLLCIFFVGIKLPTEPAFCRFQIFIGYTKHQSSAQPVSSNWLGFCTEERQALWVGHGSSYWVKWGVSQKVGVQLPFRYWYMDTIYMLTQVLMEDTWKIRHVCLQICVLESQTA